MTRPTPYLIRMVLFLVVVGIIVGWLWPRLAAIFLNNPELNSLILGILVIGVAWTLIQVIRLGPEVEWVLAYQNPRRDAARAPHPRLLAPMARMLTGRDGRGAAQARVTLSALSTRSLLDSIASRLDESRELARYMTGLLIFLGLLGTFWGLLRTVGGVSEVIHNMTLGTSDLPALFEQLKAGLAQPLNGMGIAFSASMFGLSAALVLGFLDLTAGQAQNRFFNELEEWLAGLTRLSSGVLSEGEGSVPVYVQALLEQTAENMESLQRILTRGEDVRAQSNQAILAVSERLSTLTDTMRASQQLMLRIGEAQAAIAPALQRLADAKADPTDEVARAHLRNIEIYLQRLLTETEQGRAQSTAELRSDLRVLTRTIAALAEEPR
ncbi:MAG TPA: flagellar motor protein MotA [Acetobacteraceae bacterium]|nr:flagellar motor protein MotA [Acetobacteraceae bacterium]